MILNQKRCRRLGACCFLRCRLQFKTAYLSTASQLPSNAIVHHTRPHTHSAPCFPLLTQCMTATAHQLKQRPPFPLFLPERRQTSAHHTSQVHICCRLINQVILHLMATSPRRTTTASNNTQATPLTLLQEHAPTPTTPTTSSVGKEPIRRAAHPQHADANARRKKERTKDQTNKRTNESTNQRTTNDRWFQRTIERSNEHSLCSFVVRSLSSRRLCVPAGWRRCSVVDVSVVLSR